MARAKSPETKTTATTTTLPAQSELEGIGAQTNSAAVPVGAVPDASGVGQINSMDAYWRSVLAASSQRYPNLTLALQLGTTPKDPTNPKSVSPRTYAVPLNTAGVPGFTKDQTYLVNFFTTIDKMTPEQLAAFQRSLWESGYYSSDYYQATRNGGIRPNYGSKFDEGLRDATFKFLEGSIEAGAANKNIVPPLGTVLEERKKQFAPMITTVEGGGGAGGPQVDVIGTQVVELPAVTDIGAMVDKASANVLGRKLNAKDRERFISLVSELYRQQGMTTADVRVSNQKAGYPFVTGGVQAAETVGKEFAGKENPFARSLFNEVKKAFPEVSFLGIWGDEEHKKRASDHNTGDALDIGFKSKQTADLILQTALKGKNVKYVILGRDVYYPDGRVDRNGASSDHKNHVHVSFFRTAPGGTAATAAGQKEAAKSGETLAGGQKNEGAATGQTAEGAAAATPTGPGMVSVVAKYPGAVSTPSGGSVLVTQTPMGQSGIEEQIRQENPVEAGAMSQLSQLDAFMQLIRSGGR